MNASDLIAVGWLTWAIGWALILRLTLAWLSRRYLNLSPNRAAGAAWLAILGIFVASFFLHAAVLGPGNLYGATPREAFSVEAYLLAPFGLPLLVGGLLVLFGDLCAPMAARLLRMVIR